MSSLHIAWTPGPGCLSSLKRHPRAEVTKNKRYQRAFKQRTIARCITKFYRCPTGTVTARATACSWSWEHTLSNIRSRSVDLTCLTREEQCPGVRSDNQHVPPAAPEAAPSHIGVQLQPWDLSPPTHHSPFTLVASSPLTTPFQSCPWDLLPQPSLSPLEQPHSSFWCWGPVCFVTSQQPGSGRLLVVVTSPLGCPPPGHSSSAATTYPGTRLAYQRCPKPTLRSSRSLDALRKATSFYKAAAV